MRTVTVADYNLGNLHSVKRACEHVGANVVLTRDPQQLFEAEKVILPGVGAFGEGMRHINELGLRDPIIACAKAGKPLLGICLGMQLLMTMSEELGIHEGLGLIRGNVVRLSENRLEDEHFKIPHIGWNTIDQASEGLSWNDPILKDISSGEFFYFVHSFGVFTASENNMLSATRYGTNTFCSMIKSDNIYGCQFHPEKSGKAGLTLLKNFINL